MHPVFRQFLQIRDDAQQNVIFDVQDERGFDSNLAALLLKAKNGKPTLRKG